MSSKVIRPLQLMYQQEVAIQQSALTGEGYFLQTNQPMMKLSSTMNEGTASKNIKSIIYFDAYK